MNSFDETTSPEHCPEAAADTAAEEAARQADAPETAQQESPAPETMQPEPQKAPQDAAEDCSAHPETSPEGIQDAQDGENAAQSANRTKPLSPYENSPYTGFYDTHPQPEKKAPRRSVKKHAAHRDAGKRALCAAGAALVLFGSCALTYRFAAHRAKAENAQTTAALNQKLYDLQNQLNAMNRSAGNSGTTIPTQGLTPAQVYARNVDSVVAISCDASMTLNGQRMEATVTGSGFILTEDGYVVTNYHVVENASAVTVTTQSDERFEATVVGHDTTADMALLKVEAQNLQAVTLGSSSELMIGDMVVAIGNPLGTLNATQTVGYISGINRQISTDNNYTTMLQTDAAINSGNSGGPLFNMKGEVVGITTAKYSGTSSSGASIEGIGFAIPIDDLKKNLEELQTNGYIRSAYLGIMGKDVDAEAVKNYGIPSGTYVESVEAGSPAEQAGICAKDIIIKLGDAKIESFNDLARNLRNFAPGDETTVTIYRGGKELTLPITLGEKPREDASSQESAEAEMPSEGSFQEWFDYFNRFSGETP